MHSLSLASHSFFCFTDFILYYLCVGAAITFTVLLDHYIARTTVSWLVCGSLYDFILLLFAVLCFFQKRIKKNEKKNSFFVVFYFTSSLCRCSTIAAWSKRECVYSILLWWILHTRTFSALSFSTDQTVSTKLMKWNQKKKKNTTTTRHNNELTEERKKRPEKKIKRFTTTWNLWVNMAKKPTETEKK